MNRARRYLTWWPLLLGPGAMAAVYVAQVIQQQWFVSRGSNESVALILLGIPLAGYGTLWYLYRRGFYLFMTSLCAAFFCREWHFAGTSKGIYVSLAALGFWWMKKGKEFERVMGAGWLKVWVWATFATYLLSQLVARRVFRYVHLPMEAQLHVPLEESVETMAHLMMIVTGLAAWASRRAKTETAVELGGEAIEVSGEIRERASYELQYK